MRFFKPRLFRFPQLLLVVLALFAVMAFSPIAQAGLIRVVTHQPGQRVHVRVRTHCCTPTPSVSVKPGKPAPSPSVDVKVQPSSGCPGGRCNK